ncbi:MAG: Zn-ribbon domain-containing OB-fold protein, partial [Planctomycetota bacterium]
MAMTERTQKNVDATFWRGEIPMSYIYTAGRAGDVFYSTIRDEGKFIGARCDKCGVVLCPPQIFCEACFEKIEGKWVDLPGTGVVHTFTVSHETYDEQPKEPTIVAFIRLDGADGGLFHWIKDVDPCDLGIGMPVEPVFKPKDQRVGSILDIE